MVLVGRLLVAELGIGKLFLEVVVEFAEVDCEVSCAA